MCRGRATPESESEEHIFILEMRAAVEALQFWDRVLPTGGRFIVVVGNAAVSFALRNGFSSNGKAMGLLLQPRVLQAWERILDVALVISEDNPADCCSRLHEAGSHDSWANRVKNLEHALAAHLRGWHWASVARHHKHDQLPWGGTKSTLRHPEGDPDDSDDDVEMTETYPELLLG